MCPENYAFVITQNERQQGGRDSQDGLDGYKEQGSSTFQKKFPKQSPKIKTYINVAINRFQNPSRN